MIFLALETATSLASVAVFQDRQLLNYRECDSSRSLTPQIISAVHQLLSDVSLKAKDLEGLVISLGPGTFTGLRVGLATMAGFRFSLGIPLVGISTLEALAWNVPHTDLPILTTVSIREDLVYWGRYQWQQSRLLCLDPDQIGKLPEVCARLSEPTIVLGDGWTRCRDQLHAQACSVVEPSSDALRVSAKSVGCAGRALLEAGEYLPEGCTPRYIQPSYAETQKPGV